MPCLYLTARTQASAEISGRCLAPAPPSPLSRLPSLMPSFDSICSPFCVHRLGYVSHRHGSASRRRLKTCPQRSGVPVILSARFCSPSSHHLRGAPLVPAGGAHQVPCTTTGTENMQTADNGREPRGISGPRGSEMLSDISTEPPPGFHFGSGLQTEGGGEEGVGGAAQGGTCTWMGHAQGHRQGSGQQGRRARHAVLTGGARETGGTQINTVRAGGFICAEEGRLHNAEPWEKQGEKRGPAETRRGRGQPPLGGGTRRRDPRGRPRRPGCPAGRAAAPR